MARRQTTDRLVLTALWLMMFSASAQVIIVAPILTEIGEALDTAASLLGGIATAYTIPLAVMTVVMGPVSDKVGRRRVLLWGCGSMAFALGLHAFANTLGLMFAVRALAGVAGGMLSGAAVAFVGDYFPYDRRGWATGWIMSGMAVGQILGIPIGKILATAYGFRWPFIMFAVTMAVATLLVWFFVPQPDVERDKGRLTVVSAVQNYAQLAKQPTIMAASFVYLLMFFSIGIYVFYLPYWLENVVGITPTQTASLFLVGGVANVVTGPAAGRLSDSVGRKPLIIVSCFGLAIVMVLTTVFVTNIWYAYLVFAVAMIMIAMRISPLQSLMTALVADARRGMLMSFAVSLGQVGFAVGSGIAGPIYTEMGYLTNTIIGAASILLMAVLVKTMLPEPDLKPKSVLVASES